MDILNFISWVKGSKIVTSVDGSQTLIPVGLKDPKRDDGYLAGAISVADLTSAFTPTFINDNVKLGPNTLPDVNNTSNSIAIGSMALSQFSGGIDNIAIGKEAMKVIANSAYNIAIGNSAMAYDSGNYQNIAIGQNAAAQGAFQDANVSIGNESAYYHQGSQRNVCIGYASNNQAGYLTNSVSIGYHAGRLINNYKTYNTFIGGYSASNQWISGSYNTALGGQSLTNLTTGQYNTAIGFYALGNHTVGNSNTVLGAYADVNNGTISGSIVLGRLATSDANNQFVVGSNSYNAGTVTTETVASTRTWTVKINGVDRKILLA